VDSLCNSESSAQLVHCLRATPSLVQLSLYGSGGWLTADLLGPLTLQSPWSAGAEARLVPVLEVLEVSDDTIVEARLFADMIESRWQMAGDGSGVAGLRSVRVKLIELGDSVGGEILKKLLRLREEGMAIQIIEYERFR